MGSSEIIRVSESRGYKCAGPVGWGQTFLKLKIRTFLKVLIFALAFYNMNSQTLLLEILIQMVMDRIL